MEKIRQLWHNFKIWFCKEEVDFFQKEIERYKSYLASTESTLKLTSFSGNEAINQLRDERDKLIAEKQAMLIVDPAKIIKTDEIVADELGRPVRKKILTIGGEQLNPELSRILREEAIYIKRTMWWDLMQNTLTNTAKLTMFENSKDFDDVRTGKALLYALDIQKKITDRILE